MQVIIVNSAPTRSALGTVNGLGQMVGCAARAVAPFFASSLFSISLERDSLGGDLVYYIVMAIIFVGSWVAVQLPPDDLKERKKLRADAEGVEN